MVFFSARKVGHSISITKSLIRTTGYIALLLKYYSWVLP